MITEDYCSYEVAKLLKEKGFDEPCRSAYIWNTEEYELCALFSKSLYFNREGGLEDYEDDSVPRISAPTHQMAMKWLREKGIECVVIPIWNTIGKQYRSYVLSDLGDRYKDNYDSYSDNMSYEEAVEAALKYSLENLI